MPVIFEGHKVKFTPWNRIDEIPNDLVKIAWVKFLAQMSQMVNLDNLVDNNLLVVARIRQFAESVAVCDCKKCQQSLKEFLYPKESKKGLNK